MMWQLLFCMHIVNILRFFRTGLQGRTVCNWLVITCINIFGKKKCISTMYQPTIPFINGYGAPFNLLSGFIVRLPTMVYVPIGPHRGYQWFRRLNYISAGIVVRIMWLESQTFQQFHKGDGGETVKRTSANIGEWVILLTYRRTTEKHP